MRELERDPREESASPAWDRPEKRLSDPSHRGNSTRWASPRKSVSVRDEISVS